MLSAISESCQLSLNEHSTHFDTEKFTLRQTYNQSTIIGCIWQKSWNHQFLSTYIWLASTSSGSTEQKSSHLHFGDYQNSSLVIQQPIFCPASLLTSCRTLNILQLTTVLCHGKIPIIFIIFQTHACNGSRDIIVTLHSN